MHFILYFASLHLKFSVPRCLGSKHLPPSCRGSRSYPSCSSLCLGVSGVKEYGHKYYGLLGHHEDLLNYQKLKVKYDFFLYASPSSEGAQHFLYFFPLPQGQGSLRPARAETITGCGAGSSLFGV